MEEKSALEKVRGCTLSGSTALGARELSGVRRSVPKRRCVIRGARARDAGAQEAEEKPVLHDAGTREAEKPVLRKKRRRKLVLGKV